MKKAASKSKPTPKKASPSRQPSAKSTNADWRAETLSRVRKLIADAAPEAVEEVKWRKPSNNMAGVPVWSHGGILCTGETYKAVVKVTFAKGASLADPSRLFNASLDGGTRRAIDIREGETLDAEAFQALIRAAVEANLESKAPKAKAASKSAAKAKPTAMKAKPKAAVKGEKVVLLSGGHPQIAKAAGDAPVQAYIAAMPGWKSDLGRRLDDLIERTVPNVQKAVRWNSPFYGVEGQGWFLAMHVLTKYVKVTFFKGISLKPLPPGGTERSGESRWVDLYEKDELNEAQMAGWIRQAASIPGWKFGSSS